MPAKGKHRRPKAQRFTRSIAVAGTGGAALALPLLGATGAHAATPQSAADSVSSASNASNAANTASRTAASAEGKKADAKKADAKKATTKTYAVRSGDSLAKIADTQDVSGGWKKLYSDNRSSIGGDPALIHPGLKLTIDGRAAATPSSDSTAPKAAKKAEKPAVKKTTTASKAADTLTATGFALPVDGATIGTPYKMSGSMWSSGYHTGVDFVVPTGTALKSVGAGTVVSAGWGGAYGNQVVLQLADGHYAQYAHLSSLSVSAGQTVTAGQQVGLSGATGNVTGPHLHFEIRTTPDYGSDVDPLAYLRANGVSV
ncbi:murein DD-endopeptidase MepM/ murein hydrolase activator NlpD [Streptomyces aurantiacus]|uniref:LysM peptidoglycan-binding domain-containing M23 family metallopeptidase n=1 Tax=Streptomyces aurantiacus TaxID=47760 RepID=UPI00278F3028|nr:LysM peptidoglycan-binding domain-containing M23 family metallopeptidase [Streptomyces aurantiacus]MDQ0773103.1 murein DD-endopeptidase MepM/ murein hydrolase activator NlpD [Streptomyces aurantiacus]